MRTAKLPQPKHSWQRGWLKESECRALLAVPLSRRFFLRINNARPTIWASGG